MVGITIIEDTIVLNVINRHDKLIDMISFKNLKENDDINININNKNININIKGIITSIDSNCVEKEISGENIKLIEKTIVIKKI